MATPRSRGTQRVGQGAVYVAGLDEFRRGLRQMTDGRERLAEFRKANRAIGQDVATLARQKAAGMGGPFRHFGRAIFGQGTQQHAMIGMRAAGPRQANWGAYATFFGAYRPQNPPWVGANWDVGVRGEGPYAVNPAIADQTPQIVHEYGEVMERLGRRAFNE